MTYDFRINQIWYGGASYHWIQAALTADTRQENDYWLNLYYTGLPMSVIYTEHGTYDLRRSH